jgi:hypothetical protein
MADPIQRKLKITHAESYHELYANNSNLRVSNWDFFFEFGKVLNVTETEVEARAEIGVFMSPQQAKAFIKLCLENLENYEKSFGEIAIQPK